MLLLTEKEISLSFLFVAVFNKRYKADFSSSEVYEEIKLTVKGK